jgi:hypothetical protein
LALFRFIVDGSRASYVCPISTNHGVFVFVDKIYDWYYTKKDNLFLSCASPDGAVSSPPKKKQTASKDDEQRRAVNLAPDSISFNLAPDLLVKKKAHEGPVESAFICLWAKKDKTKKKEQRITVATLALR